MKIATYSDIHLEFDDWQLPDLDVDVVVLAGDIDIKGRCIAWIREYVSRIPVIVVLGNHDLYGATYPKLIDKLQQETAGSNIHVLEKDKVIIDGVAFLGATLWTDFALFGDPRVAGFTCQELMTDFRRIRVQPRYSKLRTLDASAIHANTLRWLERELSSRTTGTTVVVTHHAPSPRSLPTGGLADITSAAYASRLDDFIRRHAIDLWIHGHVHNSCDYQIGSTRVVCNPRGYGPDEFNPDFDPYLSVDV